MEKIKNSEKTYLILATIFFIIIQLFLYWIFQFNIWIIGIILVIPITFVILFFILTNKKSYSLIKKYLYTFGIIIGTQIIIIASFVGLIFAAFKNFDEMTTQKAVTIESNQENYTKQLNQLPKKYKKHFPKKIPNNANNIIFYNYKSAWFGSQTFYLKFTTTPEFIKNEIDKYEYWQIITPHQDLYENTQISLIKHDLKIALDNYTFYIIGNHKKDNAGHYSLEYGIATSGANILYYYINSD